MEPPRSQFSVGHVVAAGIAVGIVAGLVTAMILVVPT